MSHCYSKNLTIVRLLIACVAGLLPAAADAAEIRPAPAPRLYVTHNHGLRFDVPRGLTYCRLPEGWVGTDHGRPLFIGPARDCDDQFSPTIGMYYQFNQSEIEVAGKIPRVLRSDLELRARRCQGQKLARPGLSLLKRTAALCLERPGTHLKLTAYALYDIVGSNQPVQDSPDHELTVVLSTTRQRFGRDLNLFRQVLAALSVCTPRWVRTRHIPPTCPDNSFWW